MVNEDPTEAIPPRRLARRRAFLDAATAVFLEKGYGAATLDDVIARSGGSRQTLYSLFGGKQGLFEAIIAETSGKIFATFHTDDLLDRTPDEVLVDIGVRYLGTVLSPNALGLYRLVLAEGVFMKSLAARFWETGPGRGRKLLAEYFEQQTLRGALDLADCETAASQFMGLLLSSLQMQCLLGVREAPGPEEIQLFVQTAVARFLDGCRVKAGPK